ncbi:DUF4856 domain-containing protein [Marinomonas sp. C2222]|uniref:DUF4856 domain-containing protein n=1 Tax=Marinomonas sargassi TaxID=2984494 RepID=A0ABT2YVF7_9GAMM|nr:DUF4856 domain-containing protein [Marinomonas sargassi]MCV2403888.1 DUF4856 domain-containing protein [Marinomonas sargassi]
MKRTILSTFVALSFSAVAADDYKFGVTLKGYEGDKTSSVSYGGQIARHALHNSLKKAVSKGDADLMAAYLTGEGDLAILDPASKDGFPVKQTKINELSKGKSLLASTYSGVITGWPGNPTGQELLQQLVDMAAKTKNGYDPVNGYDYTQLVSKFAMGAVFYHNAVNRYLDEKIEEGEYPNDKPYKAGTVYTGKEHVWDEGFGYFGAPANGLSLTPKEVVNITKQKAEAFSKADANGDGKVDLKSEMAFAHAYYAASTDASAGTNYFHTIMQAFVDGRKLIESANGEKMTKAQHAELRAYADVIATAWQQVIAEAAYKYAGSVFSDIDKIIAVEEAQGDVSKSFRNYVKHWGELKGFALALEAAGRELGSTQADLDRLIGFSPILFGDTQVLAVDGKGKFIQGSSISMQEYKLNMIKTQNLLAKAFNLKAKLNDKTAGMNAVLDQINSAGKSVEND